MSNLLGIKLLVNTDRFMKYYMANIMWHPSQTYNMPSVLKLDRLIVNHLNKVIQGFPDEKIIANSNVQSNVVWTYCYPMALVKYPSPPPANGITGNTLTSGPLSNVRQVFLQIK